MFWDGIVYVSISPEAGGLIGLSDGPPSIVASLFVDLL